MRRATRRFRAGGCTLARALASFAVLALSSGVSCAAKTHPERLPSAWCNVDVPAHASKLRLPPTEDVVPGEDSLRWVVVWATWCQPCESEWPRIERSRALLANRGRDVRPTLLSIDADTAVVAAYLRAHPELAASAARVLRSTSADDFEAWARELGLASAESGLPFHLVAAPDGRLTCIHAGPLLDEDVANVVRLLAW